MEHHESEHEAAARVRAEFEQRQAEERARQALSQAAIDGIEDPKVRDLVVAMDRLLSIGLGGPSGYFPTVGGPETDRARAALAAFGVEPDYGARIRIERHPQIRRAA